MSDGTNNAAANETRIRQPPEKSDRGCFCCSAEKPRPYKIAPARDSAELAPMTFKRSCSSPILIPSLEASAFSSSASSSVRSVSACSTQSNRDTLVSEISCLTVAIRCPLVVRMSPSSGAMSPKINRNSVVLPVPFRPVRPTFCPSEMWADALSNSKRPPNRNVMSLISSMVAGL